MHTTTNPTVSLRLADLEQPVRERGPHAGQTIRRDLQRYYDVLAVELRSTRLSTGQARLLVDALKDARMDERSVRFMWAQVQEAADRASGETVQISSETEALIGLLRTASHGQLVALLDAAERYWQEPDSGARLYEVGLVNGEFPGVNSIDLEFAGHLDRFIAEYGPALKALADR